MFVSKEPKLFNMITFLVAGLLMISAAAQTSNSTTDTQTALTTEAFENVFGGEPVTFALPASVSESAPMAQSACGSIGTRLGFIGIPCSVDQRTTLATITSSSNFTTSNRGTATVTTVVTDSHVSTTTEALMTITKTISVITKSAVVANSTATGMCYWSNENIITPCTVTVLNTATLTASSGIPTTSKSAAIPHAHNPFKTATDLVKRSINSIKSSVSDILTALNTLLFSGSTETINAYSYSVLTHDRPSPSTLSHRHTHAHTAINSRAANSINCLEPPSLYTPAIMTLVAIFDALILYCAWDPVHYPSKTSNLVALYIVSFITAYVIAIYVEFFFITVGPMWKVCIATSEGWNEMLAAGGVAAVCNYTDMGMGN